MNENFGLHMEGKLGLMFENNILTRINIEIYFQLYVCSEEGKEIKNII